MSGKARRREQKAARAAWFDVAVPDAVPDDLKDDAHWALSFKQMGVGENMFGIGDIPPLVGLYRDGDLLCRAYCNTIDREQALQFIEMSVPGFGADAITLVADTHAVDQRWYNRMGRDPDPHELQHLCDNEGACDLGLTTDSIFMTRMTRGAPGRYVHFPYHVNKRLRQVHWQPEVEYIVEGAGFNIEGRIPAIMRAVLDAGPTPLPGSALDPEFAPLDGMPEGEKRWHADMALLAMLTMIGFPIQWNMPEGEEAQARQNAALSGFGVSVNGTPPTGQPSPVMLAMAEMARDTLAERSKVRHAAEMQDAARRRAERGEEPRPG